MRRFHLLELHEQTWYPETWRQLFQTAMGRAMSLMKPYENLIGRFQGLLEAVEADAVLDLCSGSGELAATIWSDITSSQEDSVRPRLLVSDLYPNLESFEELKSRSEGLIDFYRKPVNALDPPQDAPRVWTMFESLHHFRPTEVRQILNNAAINADGFVAFESTQRTLGTLLKVIVGVPVISAVTTAFLLRPFRARNLLWGLLIPTVPITTTFDGLVSNLRTYTVDELREITSSIDNNDFLWEIGTAEMPYTGGLEATYVIGWRDSMNSDIQPKQNVRGRNPKQSPAL